MDGEVVTGEVGAGAVEAGEVVADGVEADEVVADGAGGARSGSDAPREMAEPGRGASVGGQQAVALGEQEAAQHGVIDRLELGAEPVEDGPHAAGVAAVKREQAPPTLGERRGAGRGHAPGC